jgi:hypothetical protein
MPASFRRAEGGLTRFAAHRVRRHRQRIGWVHLAWLAALLGLLACPIDYRGGAEMPHAHAVFQLIYDAAHGSIDHHHDDGDPAPVEDFGDRRAGAPAPEASAAPGARLSPMSESVEGLVLALGVVAFVSETGWERRLTPAADVRRDGQRPSPEPPPPRQAFAFG